MQNSVLEKKVENSYPFSLSQDKFNEIVDKLSSKKNFSMNHSDLENFIQDQGRELMRRLLEEHIKLRGNGYAGNSVTGSDDVERTYKQESNRTLTSIFGKIEINRLNYFSPGEAALSPKDADLNLPTTTYSHGLRKMVAIESAKGSFEEALASIERSTQVKIPKRQIQQLSIFSAQDFDQFYCFRCPDETLLKIEKSPLMIITVDGKGIVMRKDDLKELTRKKAEIKVHKMEKRLSRGEKKNCKRMAIVASVYNIEENPRTPDQILKNLSSSEEKSSTPPKPICKRVWASVKKSQGEVIEEMFAEAFNRDPEKSKKWVCLVDGNPSQIENLKAAAKKFKIKITIVLDIIHVIEYLWKAARVLFDESSFQCEQWVKERLYQILQGKSSYVASGMRHSASSKKLDAEKRAPLDTCADYLLSKGPYLPLLPTAMC